MTERTPEHPNTGEPRLAAFASWAVLFASFGLSASTWIALALLAGFTGHVRVFGGLFALAWLMPIAIDGYVVCALVLWTAPVPARVAVFARKNTYAAASVGVLAQSAYHALTTWTATGTVWRAAMAAVVGALPPGVAALAVHMRALIRREAIGANIRTATGRTIDRVRPVQAVRPPAVPSTPIAVRPNTPDAADPNTRNVGTEQPDTPAANVRPITSARPRTNTKPAGRANTGQANSTREQKLQRIKDAYPQWRTNMPSVRQIAEVLSVAPSSAHPYQQDLVRETQQPPAASDPDGADDEERQPAGALVGVG